tara:strand:+ start:826 stop:1962 length:1137 start_codon:yes stop_codon:yes gene_type:complete
MLSSCKGVVSVLNLPSKLGDYPLVSVAMASYNGERFIAQQLESIIQQDYPNIEIIISDDKSSDRTIQILKSYVQMNSSVTIKIYSNQENLGYIKNFEHAIKFCSGDYIAFSDQDDIWQPNKISIQVEEMIRTNALACYSDASLVDEAGECLNANLWAGKFSRIMPSELNFRSFYLANCVSGCTLLIDRVLLEVALPFVAGVPHDWWIAYHAAFQDRLCFSQKKLIKYRQHDNNAVGAKYIISNKSSISYLKKKIDKLEITVKIVEHVQGILNIFNRISAMHSFEKKTSQGATEELELLHGLVSDKISGRAVSHYGDFFSSDNLVFQIYDSSKKDYESIDCGISRVIKRVIMRVLFTLFVLLVLLSFLYMIYGYSFGNL